MLRTETRDRLAAIVGLSLILALVPACDASAGHGFLRRPAGEVAVVPPSPYVTYRPTFPVPGSRPLTLSSYAGYNYPSRAPGAAVTPTDFRILTGKPVPSHWGWFGGTGR